MQILFSSSSPWRVGASLLVLVVACSLAFSPSPSLGGPRDKPSSAIEDPAWLREKLEEIRKKYDLPALAACLVYKGKVIAASAVGVRKLGSEQRVTRDDPFLTCSITKPMTATLIGRLVDRGALRWELTLAEAFPGLQPVMKAPYRQVTLTQLLAHASGMPGGPSRGDLASPNGPKQETERRFSYVLLALLDKPLARPGTRHIYGGGSILAAAMAERATGSGYEYLMRKYVFEPLGMKTAGFGPMASSGDAVDAPWEHASRDGKLIPCPPDPSHRWHIRAPAGNVHCSIIDLGRFAAAHLVDPNGEAVFLKASTLKHLHGAVVPRSTPGFAKSQVGWSAGEVLWHNGSNGRNTCVLNIVPAENFATCVMTNAGGQGRHGEALGETHRFLVERAKKLR